MFEYCKKCVSDFTESGGCDCMENEGCDQLKLIPEGCSKCGEQATNYCSSKEGNNTTKLSINPEIYNIYIETLFVAKLEVTTFFVLLDGRLKPCNVKNGNCVPKCSELTDDELNRGLQCALGKRLGKPGIKFDIKC